MRRDLMLFVQDIKESCEAIFDFIENMELEEFANDRKTYSAVIREFEIIGEAVKHLPKTIFEKYPQIRWRDIGDFRNLLIHEYFGVDNEIVFNTAKLDLPELYETIRSIENDLNTQRL